MHWAHLPRSLAESRAVSGQCADHFAVLAGSEASARWHPAKERLWLRAHAVKWAIEASHHAWERRTSRHSGLRPTRSLSRRRLHL